MSPCLGSSRLQAPRFPFRILYTGNEKRSRKLAVYWLRGRLPGAPMPAWKKPHSPGYTVGCSDSSKSGSKLKSTAM